MNISTVLFRVGLCAPLAMGMAGQACANMMDEAFGTPASSIAPTAPELTAAEASPALTGPEGLTSQPAETGLNPPPIPAASGSNTFSRPATGLRVRPDAAKSLFSPEVEDLPPPPSRVLTLDLTHNANDIWDRMRRGFRMPDLVDDSVTQMQVFYLSRPGFLRQVFDRGRPYLHHFLEELEAKGMPTELAILPMVESAYNPMAYSTSRASGLWQFIPSTGRNFNLTQNSWVDERRDVAASTSAALDYLQTIYEMHGDWHLALASYNWGEGAVARAIKRNEAAGKATGFLDLTLPDQTRRYVPKLQALKNIIAQPELFNITLPYIPNRPYFVLVDSPAGIDLGTAAHLADTPVDEFIILNPGFNRPVIPTGAPQLAIPFEQEALFRANLEDYRRQGKGWHTYRLQKGDRFAELAEKAGTSAAALRRVNGLKSDPRAGEVILLPVGVDVSQTLKAVDALAVRGIRVGSEETDGKKTASSKSSKSGKSASKAKGSKATKSSKTTKSSSTKSSSVSKSSKGSKSASSSKTSSTRKGSR